MAAAIDDLAFELCWSFDRPARRRQAVRTWHKRGHKTRLSKCACACCGELVYRGFCKFPRFCRVCASLLCPAIVSIFGVSIRVRPLFFGVPTIFACPLIRPLFSGACPLFSVAHYFLGSALISAQKVRVEAFKQKQPIRSRHLLNIDTGRICGRHFWGRFGGPPGRAERGLGARVPTIFRACPLFSGGTLRRVPTIFQRMPTIFPACPLFLAWARLVTEVKRFRNLLSSMACPSAADEQFRMSRYSSRPACFHA